MELDFEKSLTYMSKDPGWVNKLLAGSGIVLAMYAVFIIPFFAYIITDSAAAGIASLLLCLICSAVLSLIMAGYYAQIVNRRINYSNTFLPDWNEFGKLIKTGLKYYVGSFIYYLPFVLLSFIFICCVAVAVDHGFHIAAFLLLTGFGAVCAVVGILTMLFVPLMMANFFRDLKILSFINFKSAFEMLKGNVGNYCILILLFIALSVLVQIIMSLLITTIVGIIFLPILYFYSYVVAAELVAQFVLCSKEKTISAEAQ